MVAYNAFNSRIALLFLRTRIHVALGVKKPSRVTSFSRTANVFISNGIPGVSTKSSSKKVIATTTGNRK